MAATSPKDAKQAGFIVDARGRRVTQLDPVIMHLTRRRSDIPADDLRALANDVGIGLNRGTRLSFWMALLCLLCLAIAVTICLVRYNAGTISASKFARNLLPYLAVVSAMTGSWISLRNSRHQKIGKAMLAHRRCPHCGYDLRGLDINADDSATVCPECGCAWRLPEVKAATEGSDAEG